MRDAGSDNNDKRSAISEKTSDKPAAPQSLADRLRAGAKALDRDEVAATQGGDSVPASAEARAVMYV